jgi:hypothetical protein
MTQHSCRLIHTKLRRREELSPKPQLRAGFADPHWLVAISICLAMGIVILPLARRHDWLGWVCVVGSLILILPFLLLIIRGSYERIHDARTANENVKHGYGEDNSG